MSQSAENQSAIIENENNFNIAMESQATIQNYTMDMDVTDTTDSGINSVTSATDKSERNQDSDTVISSRDDYHSGSGGYWNEEIGGNNNRSGGNWDEEIVGARDKEAIGPSLERDPEDGTNSSHSLGTINLSHETESEPSSLQTSEKSAMEMGTMLESEPEKNVCVTDTARGFECGQSDVADIQGCDQSEMAEIQESSHSEMAEIQESTQSEIAEVQDCDQSEMAEVQDCSQSEMTESQYVERCAESFCDQEAGLSDESKKLEPEFITPGSSEMELQSIYDHDIESSKDTEQNWQFESEQRIETVAEGRAENANDENEFMMEESMPISQTSNDAESETIMDQQEFVTGEFSDVMNNSDLAPQADFHERCAPDLSGDETGTMDKAVEMEAKESAMEDGKNDIAAIFKKEKASQETECLNEVKEEIFSAAEEGNDCAVGNETSCPEGSDKIPHASGDLGASSGFHQDPQEFMQDTLKNGGHEPVEDSDCIPEDIMQSSSHSKLENVTLILPQESEKQVDVNVHHTAEKNQNIVTKERYSAESPSQTERENTDNAGNISTDMEVTESKQTDPSAEKISDKMICKSLDEDQAQTMDSEMDRASDATIEEGRDGEDQSTIQVTDIKSGIDAEGELEENQDQVEGLMSEDTNVSGESKDVPDTVECKLEDECMKKTVTEGSTAEGAIDKSSQNKSTHEEDDDVVVLDDEVETASQVKKDVKKGVFNSVNDMGIHIESVSGEANEVHGTPGQLPVKQENSMDPKAHPTTPQGSKKTTSSGKKSRTQTCIVCKKVGKCKYNIVRNGDIKHLCDDTCFKQFRSNPTMFLKGKVADSVPAAEKKSKAPSKPEPATKSTLPQSPRKPSSSGYKTCTVCLLMNINTQCQFCMWKGFDFCGEGCLGKFQSGISSSCALCMAFIPLPARFAHCLPLGDEMRPFCSNRCYADYKLRLRLCAYCQKDAAAVPDAFFSAPVGSEGSFKDFCSQTCMKKFEDVLSADVEILKVETGKLREVKKCSVCEKKEPTKHSIKYGGKVHSLCGDKCLSAFQYTNKLDMKACDFCGALCTSRQSSLHTVQFEGHQKHFCSDVCVTKFRLNSRKVSPCSWCGTQRDNFDMIERLDSNNKYQLFCSLNCLSLYRVNLQAKSNQAVTCDQCSKHVPAQYHLTMSDASVRNFCSYNCVMTFQAQFSKGAPQSAIAPTPPPPRHKHNTRGKTGRGRQQMPAASVPIISNVCSLAPQGGPKANLKNSTGHQVKAVGGNQNAKDVEAANLAAFQQQVIVQPPPPKPVRNKSLLCKPLVQTKATSCRPHTQNKDCQTDEMRKKPVLIPVPVPIYLPTPMAMYSAPAPTPIFTPIPIPVPIFIPTTRKSAAGIMKQIKEIREKTPSDPLEAELLMMAAAVSADGRHSSDSESEEEMLPEINRWRKQATGVEDDEDNDVMPLTEGKEEEGGEEDMISMALRMAEEMSGPITDLESAVEAVPVNTDPPPQLPRSVTPDAVAQDEELIRNRRGSKRGGSSRRGTGRPAKRPRTQPCQPEHITVHHQAPAAPPPPPIDANYRLKFTYGVNAWRHWVLFKNNQIEQSMKVGSGRLKLFKTDILQCTADELNFSLCLFVKEVRKPNGEEYSPDSIYYLTLGIQQYLFENGRIDNIFTDFYYEKFTECLTQILCKCQPKFNSSGQMVCRIEEEHLWECKQLGAHSPYVLLNTLIYFHTKYFMLKSPEDHMKLSFAHILKYWKKGQPGKGGQPARSVSLRYYSVSTAKKDGSAPTSATKKGSKDGIPVYEVTENQDNPLRCPVKLYEFYLSKCPESIKNRSDIFYPVPERSCVPDSPVWYSTVPVTLEVMTKMLTRILLVREIQEAHLHAQPIYV